MKAVYLFFFWCPFFVLKAQKTNEELDRWISGFSTSININQVSDDRRFVLLNKYYRNNSDTVLVFDSRSFVQPVDTILKKGKLAFMSNSLVFAAGGNEAELVDLKDKGKRHLYSNIRKAEVLSKKKQYLIFDKGNRITIYNQEGGILNWIENVGDFITDGKSNLFLSVENGNGYEVMSWDGRKVRKLYSSVDKITKIEVLPSDNFLVIHQNNNENETQKYTLTLVRISDGKLFSREFSPAHPVSALKVFEVHDQRAFLVNFQNSIPRPNEDFLETWYGSDPFLRDKKKDLINNEYFLWNVDGNQLMNIPTYRFTKYMSMNDSRYLWAYDTKEERSYTDFRSVSIYRYDVMEQKEELVFNHAAILISGADRRFTLGYLSMEKQWVAYDHLLKKSKVIKTSSPLLNPVFLNNQTVLFETDNGMLRYSLLTGQSTLIHLADQSKITFQNVRKQQVDYLDSFRLELRNIDTKEPLLINVKRKDNDDNGLFAFQNEKMTQLLPYTKNRVKNYNSKVDGNIVYTIEENYNLSPSLYLRKAKGNEKKFMYGTNRHDKEAASLKQDIISYKNSVKTSLKGVLYFPLNFDPSKKYPVVVQIYNVLNGEADRYLSPDWGVNGFNKRLLLQKGYFVFQPDIVFDARGSGLSALDCVHSGLDAISGHSSVDLKKIGLIGHSLGGYEVNFIATHSNRFSAYISGASLADIPSFYSSFSELFNIANYSRFETGQFSIGKSYAEDQDLYLRNNPMNFVENVNAPMLLWSGKKDTNVPYEQTLSFYMSLLRNKKKVIALIYPQQEHSIDYGTEELKDLNNRVTNWWDYFLKDKRPFSWIDKEMKRDAE